ncbi:MAG: hypothetical protein HFE66_03685 [Clostridiales bacterium]|nr:hypothetical protein [Clostridiales bacterium]
MKSKNESNGNPTYLYDFIRSIAPLRGDNIPPRLECVPNTLVYGYADRETVSAYLQELPAEGECFQLYASLDDPDKLLYTDVSAQVAYLKSITIEEFTVPKIRGGRGMFYAAIAEGIILFDLLDALSNRKFFGVAGGVAYLSALFENDAAEEKIFIEGVSNPMHIDIFIAQVRFFFAKYFACVFSHLPTQSLKESGFGTFEEMLGAQIFRYKGYLTWNAKSVTGMDNKTFQLFAMQLQAMIEEASAYPLEQGSEINKSSDKSPLEHCNALGITNDGCGADA